VDLRDKVDPRIPRFIVGVDRERVHSWEFTKESVEFHNWLLNCF